MPRVRPPDRCDRFNAGCAQALAMWVQGRAPVTRSSSPAPPVTAAVQSPTSRESPASKGRVSRRLLSLLENLAGEGPSEV
jgi:hypothetical protein